MLNNERIGDYLDSLCPGNSAIIETIRKHALEENMPIIRRDGEQFLKTLLAAVNPGRILEIGTNVGYSAIIMATAAPQALITTVEIGEADYRKALANIESAGLNDRIGCILGDATDVLRKLEGPYDFIFMDAAKAQYINWLPEIERLTSPGSMMVSDNVLHDGDIVESRYAIDRRDRTTHARMREYLHELTHSDKWETSVINVADGMSVSVRK